MEVSVKISRARSSTRSYQSALHPGQHVYSARYLSNNDLLLSMGGCESHTPINHGSLPTIPYSLSARTDYFNSSTPQVLDHDLDFSSRSFFEPIVSAIGSDPSSEKRILVHLFSNGGSLSFADICHEYKQQRAQTLPVQAIVFDIAVRNPTSVDGWAAMSIELPKRNFVVLSCRCRPFCDSAGIDWDACLSCSKSDSANESMVKR